MFRFKWKINLGIMYKSLLALLALSLISFAAFAFISINYMGGITDFARLSNISLGNTAADTSSTALTEQSQQMIRQKTQDMAEQVSLFIRAYPDITRDALTANAEFRSITLQTVGEAGYTFLFDQETAIVRLHPDPSMMNIDLHQYQAYSADFWNIISPSLNGSISEGYYNWKDENNNAIQKFIYIVPVKDTKYLLASSINADEFSQLSREIREEINAAALSTSEYINQQKLDMYKVFVALIFGLMAVVGVLAYILAVRITRPIIALKEGSRIIANGDFDHRVNVKTGDEIEELANEYNTMAGRLKESYADMEQKVEKRTVALRQSNSLLQQEITQREQAEEALRQSEIRYRHLVEKANCIILEMDTAGKVTFFNKFGQEFFGYNESEIVGKDLTDTIVPKTDSAGQNLEEMIKDIIIHPEKYNYNENENIRKNGEKAWLVWSNQPIYGKDEQMTGLLCIGMDHTALKQAEELREKQATEGATAAERTRLARDLHDAVSQTLFSASIIADVLPRLWERNPEEGRKRLAEIRELTRGALAEMRTLLLELRPSALIEAELGTLLYQLGESVTGRARIPVSVNVTGQYEMPVDAKVVLYRIAQEALNNVAKHSGATQVQVKLDFQPDHLILSIVDNGRGFDIQKVAPDSLGTGIMRERARSIGAALSIESQPDQGTKIMVSWKYTNIEK